MTGVNISLLDGARGVASRMVRERLGGGCAQEPRRACVEPGIKNRQHLKSWENHGESAPMNVNFKQSKLFRRIASSRYSPPKNRRSARPMLEQLEGRQLLSGNVQIQLYGVDTIDSYAGVGLQENQVADMNVQVNGQPDTNKGDFQAQIQWGDGESSTGDLVYQGTNQGYADYLIKGSHVYQNTGTQIPVTLTVTGPGGATASFLPDDIDHADVWAMPSGMTGTQPPASANSMPPANVQIQVSGSPGLSSYAGVGFQENDVGTMLVQVNGQPDTTLSDFHAQINWGDSASWTAGDLVYQGSDSVWAHYLIKGSHVYQNPDSDFPIVVYVTGPDGTSASLSPSDVVSSQVWAMPNGKPGALPPATARSMPPANVQINLAGSCGLSCSAGVGFEDNAVGYMTVMVNGKADATVSDFHAQINWGDSTSWTSGDLVYQGSDGGGANYLIEGSHVYQNPSSHIPIVVYVTGPDGTSASLSPSDLDYADVAPNPNGLSLGNLTPAQWNLNEPGYDGTITVSGGAGSYTNLAVTGLPGGLSAELSGSNITVSGTPTQSGTFSDIAVSLEDSNGDKGSGTESLTINAPAISIGNLTPAEWTLHEPGYDGTIAVSGGSGTYTNLAVTGLPGGLSAELSGSNITVSGTPTQSGSFSDIAVSLEDNSGDKGSGTESLTITAAPLTLGSLSPAQWDVNEPDYDGTIAVSGGSGSYTNLSVTGLPAGLSANLSGGTITISGTPTQSGTFTVGVAVDDGTDTGIGIAASPIRSAGVTSDDSTGEASATDKLTINAAPKLGPLSPLTTVGSQAQFTMPVSGGTAPYKLSSITGLPKGLKASLSGSTITIIGMPATLGSFNCVVNLSDSKGAKPSNPKFVLTINATTIGQGDGVAQANGAEKRLTGNQALATALSKAATGTVAAAELRTIISIESTANPNVGVKGNVAGPFQVSIAAASDAGYKLTLDQLANWQTNVTVAAKNLNQWCAKQLVRDGIPVTPLNLYLFYQQGSGGFPTLWAEVQDRTASGLPATPNELSNVENLTNYIPTNQITVQDYYSYWVAKFAAENAIVNPTNNGN